MNTMVERLANLAVDRKRSFFFDVCEVQKVSLRLVDRRIQLYLYSPRMGILINTLSNGLHVLAVGRSRRLQE